MDKIKGMERSWFWIALLSMVNMLFTSGSAPVYFKMAAEVDDYESIVFSGVYIVAAAGIFLVPLLLRRRGVLDDPVRFKSVFLGLTGAGIVSMVVFAVICNTIVPEITWPAFIFQFIAVIAPAVTAGCALHRMVKTISIKSAVTISALFVIGIFVLVTIHLAIISNISEWRSFELSYIIVYAVMSALPAALLLFGRDRFAYQAPGGAMYFPEALFRKFIILAILITAMGLFYDLSYYAGGDLDALPDSMTLLLFALPAIIGAVTIPFLRKGKWLAVIAAFALIGCFQQGLTLFFDDTEALMIAYALMDSFTGNYVILFFLIPLVFCVQRRKGAVILTGLIALELLEATLVYIFPASPEPSKYSFSSLASPAITFVLSIVTIAYLFYLYGEYNRVHTEALSEDFIKRLEAAKLSADEAMKNAGFTERETEVALLLIDGNTRSDILRKLRIPAADVSRMLNSIRDKISGIGSDRDRAITAAVLKYKLTGRELNMLQCLRTGMTNPQIAAELVIAEETVKKHVRSLMSKLPLDDRHEIPAWLESADNI